MTRPPQQEMFGVPAQPLVDAVESADSLAWLAFKKHVLPFGVDRESLQTVVDIWPLVEDVRRGSELRPRDVRPYTGDILDNIVTNPALRRSIGREGDRSTARKLYWLGHVSGIGFVRDRALPRLEGEFSWHVRNQLDSPGNKQRVAEGLEVARPYVEAIAEYDDPRGQFLRELDALSREIRYHTREARDARLAVEYARRPAHTFRGWLLRWRYKNKTPDELIKPIDAAHGIDQTFRRILQEDAETTTIPLMRTIIDTALAQQAERQAESAPSLPAGAETQLRHEEDSGFPSHPLVGKIPPIYMLEAAAPEIMKVIESGLPENNEDDQFLVSIQKRFSFRAKLGRFFSSKPWRLRVRGTQFVQAARDSLPRSGREVTRAFDEIREFFLT